MKSNEKDIDRKILSPWKRIGAIFLDFIMVFFLSLLFDRVLVNPVAKRVTALDELTLTYDSEVKEYQHLEDKYRLYYYDEDANRIKNENITDEELNAFMSDERVITLRKEVPEVQDTLQAIRWTIVGIDAFIGSLIYFIFAYVIFGVGRSFGLMIFNARMTDLEGKKIKFKKAILYGFLKWVMIVPLGAVTILILPIKLLYELFYKDGITFIEKKLNIECRIIPKYIE